MPDDDSSVRAAQQWYGEQHETPLDDRGNFLTRRWGHVRGLANRVRDKSGIKQHIRQLQREWLCDVSGKRVLDLGCGAGNNISVYLAQSAASYLAFDLSEAAIQSLRRNLDERGLRHAETASGNFLDPHFPYEPFDAVYANSVLHAFHPLEDALSILFDRMTPGGKLVTMEPLATSPPVWALRRVAKRFRSDAAFNWPFTRNDFKTIQRFFEIEAVQGFYGWSKWALPLALVPRLEGAATAVVKRLHAQDAKAASHVGRGLWRCNSVTMLLRRR